MSEDNDENQRSKCVQDTREFVALGYGMMFGAASALQIHATLVMAGAGFLTLVAMLANSYVRRVEKQ
jgi:hypothetical protein